MPRETSTQRNVQVAVKEGFQRMHKFKRGRAMYLREAVGHYYRGEAGNVGDEPINMIYHVIRSLVPNLVMRHGINQVTTEITDYKSYAYMLGLALDGLSNRLNLKLIIRRAVVDALFAMGIVKIGINATDSLIDFGDVRVDPGQVYCDNVDFDDFVIDSGCKVIEEAVFQGHRMRVPRMVLLEDDNYDHDIVAKLPRARVAEDTKNNTASGITLRGGNEDDMLYTMEDYVDVIELFMPQEQVIITIPDPFQVITDKYIGIQDYYGPSHGPYRFLSLSQPVPGNPFPIAPVGIWHDLHVLANRLMKKQMDRADAQKTVFVVDPNNADTAEDIREAADGEVIFGDPQSVNVVSTVGAEVETDRTLSNLHTWFNYLAGNPDQMAGVASDANTATQATILSANANVVSEDRRGMIYDFNAGINEDMGWFLHYDPFIDLPLTARKSPDGSAIPFKAGEQLQLTPSQRRGEHFHFAFKMRPRSMSAIDPMVISKRIMEFATNVIPSLVTSAQMSMSMGVPFNLQRAITKMADQLDLSDYVQDWFEDPEFLARIEFMKSMGPQPEGKAGTLGIGGVMQNHGLPTSTGQFGKNDMAVQAQQIGGMMQSASGVPGGPL